MIFVVVAKEKEIKIKFLRGRQMEFRDLISKYNEYLDIRATRFKEKKLSDSHIEDENQSVKWNREFVEQYNKKVDAHRYQLQTKIRKAYDNYIDSILDLISSELTCDINVAVAIYDYVYGIKDWDGEEEDKLDAIEEIVELIKNIRKGL